MGKPVAHCHHVGQGTPGASAKSEARERTEGTGFCYVDIETIRRSQIETAVVRKVLDVSLLLTNSLRLVLAHEWPLDDLAVQ